MRSGNSFWSGSSVRRSFFLLITLLAWVASGSLFIVLRQASLTRASPAIVFFPIFCSLLPWLAGLVFWLRVGRRAKLGVASGDEAGFCYSIIILIVGTAYVAIVSVEPFLLWALTRGK